MWNYRAEVKWWAKVANAASMTVLLLGTFGSLVYGLSSRECADDGYYSCDDWDYPALPGSIGLALVNFQLASVSIAISRYIGMKADQAPPSN